MKIISAAEAANLVPVGATIAVSGCNYRLVPETVLGALQERFASVGQPHGLTLIYPIMGERARAGRGGAQTGVNRIAQPGLLKRIIGGSFSRDNSKELNRLIRGNHAEAYNLPMGTIFGWLRAVAAGLPGLITPVGLGTFVDPRQQGGRMNEAAKEPLASLLTLNGREQLFYPAQPVHVALLRATTADERGNLAADRDPFTLGLFHLAAAARNSGGRVIAEVNRVARAGSLHPRSVVVPAALVDAIVVNPEEFEDEHDPSMSGELDVPVTIPTLPLTARTVIARRALQELPAGAVVNLGAGIPMYVVPAAAVEAGRHETIHFTIEQGPVGGLPEVGGVSRNPSAILDSLQVFDWYDGGGIDVSLLGFGQVDREGHVNVSRFGELMPGCGGFLNITHGARKIVFCGTLTGGGLEIAADGGGIRILREGRTRKFVQNVEQITFNARDGLQRGQQVLYVTERGVFKLTEDGLLLIEIAPGIEVARDVVPHVEFPVRVDEACGVMPESILGPWRHTPR